MRFKLLVLTPAGMLLATAGCAPVDPGFGEAVKYDMAAQTIDPDPVYPADSLQPGYHGEKGQKATERYRKESRGQKATERYRKGQTKPLRIEGTQSGGSGGGGGGGSPGGSN